MICCGSSAVEHHKRRFRVLLAGQTLCWVLGAEWLCLLAGNSQCRFGDVGFSVLAGGLCLYLTVLLPIGLYAAESQDRASLVGWLVLSAAFTVVLAVISFISFAQEDARALGILLFVAAGIQLLQSLFAFRFSRFLPKGRPQGKLKLIANRKTPGSLQQKKENINFSEEDDEEDDDLL